MISIAIRFKKSEIRTFQRISELSARQLADIHKQLKEIIDEHYPELSTIQN